MRILHKMVLIICEFPAFLHMEGSTFVVVPSYVRTVISVHFQIGTILNKPGALHNKLYSSYV